MFPPEHNSIRSALAVTVAAALAARLVRGIHEQLTPRSPARLTTSPKPLPKIKFNSLVHTSCLGYEIFRMLLEIIHEVVTWSDPSSVSFLGSFQGLDRAAIKSPNVPKAAPTSPLKHENSKKKKKNQDKHSSRTVMLSVSTQGQTHISSLKDTTFFFRFTCFVPRSTRGERH